METGTTSSRRHNLTLVDLSQTRTTTRGHNSTLDDLSHITQTIEPRSFHGELSILSKLDKGPTGHSETSHTQRRGLSLTEDPGVQCSVQSAGRSGARSGSSSNAARERCRVRTLRAAFLDLQRSLPAVPRDTKLSKLDVLMLATTYIAQLTSTLAKAPGTGHSPACQAGRNDTSWDIVASEGRHPGGKLARYVTSGCCTPCAEYASSVPQQQIHRNQHNHNKRKSSNNSFCGGRAVRKGVCGRQGSFGDRSAVVSALRAHGYLHPVKVKLAVH